MADLEKVIRGLECCTGCALFLNDCPNGCPFLEGTESGEECVEHLHADALTLLQFQQERIRELEAAQEPRLMTLEEVEVFAKRKDDPAPIWAEWYEGTPCTRVWWEASDIKVLLDKLVLFPYGLKIMYGVRFWTSRPTGEQREAVEWDE